MEETKAVPVIVKPKPAANFPNRVLEIPDFICDELHIEKKMEEGKVPKARVFSQKQGKKLQLIYEFEMDG
jgi:hypothetical protein